MYHVEAVIGVVVKVVCLITQFTDIFNRTAYGYGRKLLYYFRNMRKHINPLAEQLVNDANRGMQSKCSRWHDSNIGQNVFDTLKQMTSLHII